MKKHLFTIITLAAVGSVSAQNLDTTSVADQFSAGSRSDQANGAAYSAPTYPEITGSINYHTTFEGGTAAETPVLNVTQTQTPDGVNPIPAIAANTGDAFSTSNNMAIYVGDFGGGQNLQWGELTNANYYVAAAVWCETRAAGVDYERTYITVRCPVISTGSNMDAIGGYAINYESDTGKVQGVEWNPNNAGTLTVAQTTARDANSRVVYGEQVVSNGWHRLEVAAHGSTITFKVDGVTFATANDSTYAAGVPSLSFREVFATSADEHQGRFDYMVSGPSQAPPVVNAAKDWQIYQ